MKKAIEQWQAFDAEKVADTHSRHSIKRILLDAKEDILELAYKRDELLAMLHTALPYIEDSSQDPAYKPGAVNKVISQIKAVIASCEV